MEVLESRICPSTLNFGAVVVTPSDPLTLGGQKLIELTAGKALVFVTDTGNGKLDSDDIVGISVTKGVVLTSNVDIHGDIVTNLNKNGTLSGPNKDGSVLVAKSNIGSLTINGSVDGQILATAAIGGPAHVITEESGLLDAEFRITITGSVSVLAAGSAAGGRDIFADVNATIQGVHIGPVTLDPYEQSGAGPSIGGVSIEAAQTLTLIQAGDGGVGGKGGDVFDTLIQSPGLAYAVIAGDGGDATKAGAGGALQQIIQTGGSVDGAILYRAGSGGDSPNKSGAAGGRILNLSLNGSGQYAILAGQGGDGGSDEFSVTKSDGGAGGNIKQVRLENGTGYTLIAGDGGHGDRNGGAGGSVETANNDANVPALFQPSFVTNADFDKDGDLDLLVLSAASDNFTIYFNDGDGNFIPRGIFSTGLNPQRVAMVDLEGDGNLDLFITNKDDDTVGIYLGNGDGTFDLPIFLATGAGPVGVAVAQMNSLSDPLLDLVVVNSLDRTVRIFFGTGGTSFNPTVTDIVISDFGQPNVVLAQSVDGDPFPDMAIANPDVANADVDSVAVFIGNGPNFGGDGTFSGPTDFLVGEQPSDLTAGLLNADIRPDLVTSNEGSDNISILFGNTSATPPNISFNPPVNITVGDAPSALALVNLNGGRPDIVVTNSGDNTLSVLLNQNDGTFVATSPVSVGSAPVSVTTGDFNSDGFQDVITANSGSSNLSVLFGKGDGTFQVAGENTAGAILQAGNGGNGETGNGGNGGYIGQNPGTAQPAQQVTDVSISALGGAPFLVRAGNGGDGFIHGGKGGTISAADFKAGGEVRVLTGSGGDGETGNGGSGGTIGRGNPAFDVTVSTGGSDLARIETGHGGDGATSGGDAGKFTNTQLSAGGDVVVVTGSGGSATVSGNGGTSGEMDISSINAGGVVSISTGNGGNSIGLPGKNGGSIVNSTLIVDTSTEEDVDIHVTLGSGGSGTAGGNGGHFRQDTVELTASGLEMTVQIDTGSGGDGVTQGGGGGQFEFITLTSTGGDSSLTNLFVDLGRGGNASAGAGGAGGSLSGLHLSGVNGDLEINNVTGGNRGLGGDGLTGGAGGSVSTVDFIPPSTGGDDDDSEQPTTLGGTITVRSGDGGNAASGPGGKGGDISAIKGEFQGVVDHTTIPDTSGLRFLAGAGGGSASAAGGAGGTVNNVDVASLETDISYIAGDGGDGSTAGGGGGDLIHLTGNSSLALLFQAGNGGAATGLGGFGGNGGKVDDIYQSANPGQMIRQIAAGNGGAASELGGHGGDGGAITKVHVLGDIGDFTKTYGYNSMGGLFAGAGGVGQTAAGANGSISDVSAGRISSIVAGIAVGPVPVLSLTNITANAIGANIDPDDPGEFVFPAFDFIDLNDNGQYDLGADPDVDPAEPPIDGLILADVISQINLPQGVLPLFTYEVSNPPPIGNIDPHEVP